MFRVLGSYGVACLGWNPEVEQEGFIGESLGGFSWGLESLGRLWKEPLSQPPKLLLKVSEARTTGMGTLCLPGAPSAPPWASAVWSKQVWEGDLPLSPGTCQPRVW